MNMKKEDEYYNIYREFNGVNKFMEMKNIVHHGNNRLDHINRVAKLSFLISKKLKLDYISCTRGAIMHDFFTLNDINKDSTKMKLFLKKHPSIALENSNHYFNVNHVEEDIIISHMYPITKEKPISREAKVVCISDKLISVYEFFRYQVKFSLNVYVIFLFKLLNL